MLGLDIGGANLKIADGRGYAHALAFALWREPSQLADQLRLLVDRAPRATTMIVTMTGELCDCFATKADGVRHILQSVRTMASGRDVYVYLNDGRIVSCADAVRDPLAAAASNWHALAAFACRYTGTTTGLLIDIGSTTTDMVPLAFGRPIPQANDDTARLIAGELVYTGVGRTPVCAVVDSLPWRGQNCPVAAEFFAATDDGYLILGDVPEDVDNRDTADGKPRAIHWAAARLARSICMDPAAFTVADAQAAAVAVRDMQMDQLVRAASRVLAILPNSPHAVVLSGAGEFLANRVVDHLLPGISRMSLRALLGPEISRCAPAHAVAQLAMERKLG